MPHSSFKSAQKKLNIEKKRNFNKDYRRHNNKTALSRKFACRPLHFSYILQTEYGIKLNENHIQYLENHYLDEYPYPINFTEFSEEENNTIKMVINSRRKFCSVDKTHSTHSKNFTKNRNKDRNIKWLEVL